MFAALIKLWFHKTKFWFVIAFAMMLPAFGASVLTPHIISMFDLGESGEMITMAALFFGLLAGEGWLYGRYQRWQFSRGRPTTDLL